MVRLRDPDGLPAGLRNPVLAVGNFDGVHRGHKKVIRTALDLARTLDRPAAVLTFDPHPRDFFQPRALRFQLTPPDVQAEIIAGLGVAGIIVLSFDQHLAGLGADAFVDDILCARLGVSGVVAGADFHYGRGRSGTPATLVEAGRRDGFAVELVRPEASDGAPVSSTRIRDSLAAGDIGEANAMLGHEWFVRGTVVHGQKLGRTLGFPTANLALDPGCGLRHGIYAVEAKVDGTVRPGVASFGRRPTFDNGAPLLETFLFDFSADLYGKSMDVAFVGFIRPEAKFASAEALVERMDEDVRAAGLLLGGR